MRRSLRSWLWRIPLEQEVDEEIAFHVEMRTRDLIAQGTDPAAAREMAVRHLGDAKRLKRTCVDIGRKRDRDMFIDQTLEELSHDVRFALRQLKNSPGFALIAALTLALGIGGNSALFALADSTLMRPLPYPDPDRLVMIWERGPTIPRAPVGPLNLRDWNDRAKSFDGLAAIALGLGGGPLLAAPDGSVESAERQSVSARFFDVLRVVPVAGRTFVAADEGTDVVVLGEGVWRQRLGADLAIIGRDVRLNGRPHTVVGVVPDHVQFRRLAQIWTLMPPLPANFTQRGQRFLEIVGRLKPGVSIDAAQADLDVIASQLAQDHPATNKDWGVAMNPLRAGLMGDDLELTSRLLLGVVAFVLFMCCANVANLLLTRATARAQELAVRSALGAGRPRIIRQLVTESLSLAAIGGVLGVGIGAAILKAAPSFVPPGLLPPAAILTFDGRVVGFCAIAALVVGVVFGVLPAWQATRTSLVQAIGAENRSSTGRGGRLRSVLAAAQIAAAVLLLCGAGLLLRTLLVFGSIESGYRVDGRRVVTADFSVPSASYPPDRMLQFYDAVERDILALPNVRRVGWSSTLPWGQTELGRLPYEIVGDPPVAAENRPTAEYSVTSDGYFRTLDIPLIAGRRFASSDTMDSTPICLVNEAFVRRHLSGRDPIGTRISIKPAFLPGPAVREIVGVVRQVAGRPDEVEEMRQVYVPLSQLPYSDVFLVAESAAGPPEALVPSIRAAVARHNPNLPVRRVRTVQDLADEATARYRFRAISVATFAALALLLAMIGVFSVLAYSVEQRQREFGLRIALGASPSQVLHLVLGSALRVIVSGGAIGLALAVALSQSIAGFLFGVQPLDPAVFGTATAVLVLTALLATIAPAIRASRVDPFVAFRGDQ